MAEKASGRSERERGDKERKRKEKKWDKKFYTNVNEVCILQVKCFLDLDLFAGKKRI